ncbi:MAG: hypothetical protein ACK4SX_05765 [Alcanivoracaceae bacterium]
MIKRLVAGLAVPLMLWGSVAQAEFQRADLDRLALDVWRVRAAFHTYTVMQGATEYLQALEDMIADTDDVLDSLESSVETDQEAAFIEQVRESWSRYRDLANSNTIAEMGYTEHYTIVDLESEALGLDRLISGQRTSVSGKGEDLAQLAVLLQHLASEYMYVAGSPDGGSGAIGTGAEEGRLEFVRAVPEFETKLKAAQQAWRGNPDISRELRSVASKWGFIRESLVKFYENSVPFIVHRYSVQMVDSLNTAAEMARQ